MRSIKYRKTKCRKSKCRKTNGRKTNGRKTNGRKTKSRRYSRKVKNMRGGDATLAKLFNIDFGSTENTLKRLEAEVYSIEHSPVKPIPKAPGMNVGQPYNRPYTGFGWFQ